MTNRFRPWWQRWKRFAWLVGALVFGIIVSSLLWGADKLE